MLNETESVARLLGLHLQLQRAPAVQRVQERILGDDQGTRASGYRAAGYHVQY